MKTARQIAFVIISVLILAEIFCRIKGWHKTYGEATGQGYFSHYTVSEKSWYHTRQPNAEFTPANSDFHYPYSTNSIGVRDKEFSHDHGDSSIKILVTGDSFAEGFGAPYDSTWPRLLEGLLNAQSQPATIWDAGVAGSDIVFDYILYRDKLSAYKPNLVIASINSSDFNDCLVRGFMQRFGTDGKTHYNKAPWFEKLYHYSYLFRAVLWRFKNYPYDGIFIDDSHYNQEVANTVGKMDEIIEKYKADAEKKGAGFAVILHPTPDEILYENDMHSTYKAAFETLQKRLTEQGIKCFYIYNTMHQKLADKPWQQYTYQHDRHFTPFGYSQMAETVADSLVLTGALHKAD